MTDQDSNTHSPTPADQPLALRLIEGLGGRFDAWMLTSASTVDLNGSVDARMRAAWNAAITEAADRCEAMCHYYQTRQRWTSADEAADTCKDEVRKLRSAPNDKGKRAAEGGPLDPPVRRLG